jgi:hypothetical protein
MEREREREDREREREDRRRCSGAYHEIAVGGRITPVGIVPPFGSGVVKYFHVFLSLGSNQQVNGVTLTIVRDDGSNSPGFPQVIDVRRGRREIFELEGGANHDALAIVNLNNQPENVRVIVLVEFDSP